jgi:hypothetical protein
VAVTGAIFKVADGERGPAGLVAGPDAAAVVAVEIFVEEHEIAEMRVASVARAPAVHGAPAAGAGEKDRPEAAGDLMGGIAQVEHLAGADGHLDQQRIAVVGVIAFEGLDQKIVDGKPDWAAPVGIAAEEMGVASAGV